MKAIPLIQKADVQSINTSIIALKEAQKELETLNIQVNRKISDLNKLLDGLDFDEIGGSGKLIQSIKQTDGKISATSVDLTSTIASGNNQPATSGGVADALSGKVNTDSYSNINLNTLINTGFYSVSCDIPNYQTYNFPTPHYGTVLVGTTSSGNLMQMFMSDDEQTVYVRNCTTNVWSSWKKVLTDNDVTNQVTSGDMKPVTSNAVGNSVSNLQAQINGKASGNGNVYWVHFTPQQFSDATYLSNLVNSAPAGSLIMFMIGWEDYQQYLYYGSSGYIMVSAGSARAYGEMRQYSQAKWSYAFHWIDVVTPDGFSGVYAI